MINICDYNVNCIRFSVDNASYLVSYRSVVAKKKGGQITLGKDWDYSRTTLKHVRAFTGKGKAELQREIAAGNIFVDEDLGEEIYATY